MWVGTLYNIMTDARIHNITRVVFISVEIEVILYTVDDTTFGKSIVCMYNNIVL